MTGVPDDPDVLTDYLAAAVAVVVLAIVLGITLHQYLTTGEIETEFLYTLLGLTAVSAILLFGAEKVAKALEVIRR